MNIFVGFKPAISMVGYRLLVCIAYGHVLSTNTELDAININH